MALEFTRICRICLKIHEQKYDIFTYFYVNRNCSLSDMLSICTKLEPHLEDGLPRHICKECIRKLKRSYTFNTLCIESDRQLRLMVENIDHKHEDAGVKSEDSSEVKSELYEEQNRTDSNEHIGLLADDGVIKDEIKLEPKEDDKCWDAEDDYMLQEIKLKKSVQESITERPKKKRSRKKTGMVEGEPTRPGSKLPHQCDICGKFLSTKSNLKAHKVCHTELRPYRCGECPAAFRGHSALFQHRKVHSGETPYHCEYCPKQFSRRTGLVNHIRMHTGEKLYSCDICCKTFVQSAQLSIHKKRHQGDKSFLCQDCGKGFPIKADLKVHQRIHNGEKPYSCPLCPKTFATSGNLNIHVRIHNKEIRYKCPECDRGFVTCSAYNVHLKRHKGQRDYQCECGKTFYTSSALKQHKVVHTGEKKYQCKICERKFTQTSHLSRHFKRDHAKPNVPVPSSDHYKLVLNEQPAYKRVFADLNMHSNPGVKCEGS